MRGRDEKCRSKQCKCDFPEWYLCGSKGWSGRSGGKCKPCGNCADKSTGYNDCTFEGIQLEYKRNWRQVTDCPLRWIRPMTSKGTRSYVRAQYLNNGKNGGEWKWDGNYITRVCRPPRNKFSNPCKCTDVAIAPWLPN